MEKVIEENRSQLSKIQLSLESDRRKIFQVLSRPNLDIPTKINCLLKISQIIENLPNLELEYITLLSRLMKDKNKQVALLSTKVIIQFATSKERYIDFKTLLHKYDISQLNENLQCIKIINYVYFSFTQNNFVFRTTSTFEEGQAFLLSLFNIIPDINSIYDRLYDFLDEQISYRKRDIVHIKQNEIEDLYNIGRSLCFYKIYETDRPLQKYLEFLKNNEIIFSREKVAYICINLQIIPGKLSMMMVDYINSITSLKSFKNSKDLILSICILFKKFFLKEDTVSNNENINDIIKRIPESSRKEDINYRVYFKIYFEFITNNLEIIGYAQLQLSIYHTKLWNVINEFLLEEISNPLSNIHEYKYIFSGKFVRLFFQKYVEFGEFYSHLKDHFSLILNFFQKINVNFIDFLDDFIILLSEDNINTSDQLGNLIDILIFANYLNIFSFDKAFFEHVDAICSRSELISSKLQLGFNSYKLRYLNILNIQFLRDFTLLLDKRRIPALWDTFFNLAKEILKVYEHSHDDVLNWIDRCMDFEFQKNLNKDCIIPLHNLVQFLTSKENPIILKSVNKQRDLLLPGLKNLKNDVYDDMEEDHSKVINFKDLLIDESMTKFDREIKIKEKLISLIKQSKNNRDYYEEIYAKLIKISINDNKSVGEVLFTILTKKISKILLNMNKGLTNLKAYQTFMNDIFDVYRENIQNENFYVSHIVLKTQLCVTYNFIILYSNFPVKEKQALHDVKYLLANCFKSLYVETNRAANKNINNNSLYVFEEDKIFENEFKNSGNRSNTLEFPERYNVNLIPDENKFNNTVVQNQSIIYKKEKGQKIDQDESKNELSCFIRNQKAISEELVITDHFKGNINNSFLIEEENEITDLIKEVDKAFTINLSDNYECEKISTNLSKYTSLFSLSGYTNLTNKSENEIMKEMSVIMKSNNISKEVFEKIEEFYQIIFELNKLYAISQKSFARQNIEDWKSDNHKLLERNNVNFLVLSKTRKVKNKNK